MKSILLTSTALVAFAGAAVADGHSGIAFSGSATLGYNDDIEDGFYWDAELDAAMSAALDNGLTASADFGLNVVDGDLGQEVSTSDYVLAVEAENAALRFGDVDPVAEANFSAVDGDSTSGFNDVDAHLDVTADADPTAEDTGAGFDAILMGEATVSDWTGMISFGVETDDANGSSTSDDLDAMQVFVGGAVGTVDLQFAYQAELGDADSVFGVAAGTSVAGADLDISYLDDGTESSIGLGVSYPFGGGVTLGGYYSVNDPSEDNFGVSADYENGPTSVSAFYDYTGNDESSEYGVEGSYAATDALTLLAGVIVTDADETTNAYYAAGTYDLGGGASLLVSYADDEGNDENDEIGDPEYMSGTTVEVSFSF